MCSYNCTNSHENWEMLIESKTKCLLSSPDRQQGCKHSQPAVTQLGQSTTTLFEHHEHNGRDAENCGEGLRQPEI